jgi:hypothetical protein
MKKREFRIVLKIWCTIIHGQWRQHGGRISDSQSVVGGFKTRPIQPLGTGERDKKVKKLMLNCPQFYHLIFYWAPSKQAGGGGLWGWGRCLGEGAEGGGCRSAEMTVYRGAREPGCRVPGVAGCQGASELECRGPGHQ